MEGESTTETEKNGKKETEKNGKKETETKNTRSNLAGNGSDERTCIYTEKQKKFNGLCKGFVLDKCRFGEKCRYYHGKPGYTALRLKLLKWKFKKNLIRMMTRILRIMNTAKILIKCRTGCYWKWEFSRTKELYNLH